MGFETTDHYFKINSTLNNGTRIYQTSDEVVTWKGASQARIPWTVSYVQVQATQQLMLTARWYFVNQGVNEVTDVVSATLRFDVSNPFAFNGSTNERDKILLQILNGSGGYLDIRVRFQNGQSQQLLEFAYA